MKISVKNGKSCEKILKVELPSESVKKEFDAYYASVAPKAKVPGFRPGKAPKSVLEMHYKDDARKNVLNQLISESYRTALKNESINPLGYPEIQDVDFDEQKLTYSAFVEVRPKIKLSKITGLKAKQKAVEVKAEEIEESLKRIQRMQAQYRTVDSRGAQKNDFVVADYVCVCEGQEIDTKTDEWIKIQEEDYIKGFSKQLTGVKPGEAKEISVKLPKDFAQKEYADKGALFKVEIKEVKEEILPELDDELAKSAGEFKTLEELKSRVASELEQTKKKEVETAFEKELLDQLRKHNKIDLPKRLVQQRLERLVQDALGNYERHGFPKEQLGAIKADLEKNLQEEAERQIHVAFLLDEIATKENLEVVEEDIAQHFQNLADQVKQPLEVVKNYYKNNMDAVDSLKEQIRSQKAIDFLKKNAKS